MRVAVTGAGGRLGTSLLARFAAAGIADEILAWDLPDHDLDDPASAERLVAAGRPDIVVHAAAWTDVDGCARQPDVAMRRNGTAVGEMARACVGHGAWMIAVSTNEVFDGARTDGLPYSPTDRPNPINAYGRAKLAGEVSAREAFGSLPHLAIARTAWLFGAPGLDFPRKILERARTLAGGEVLKLVDDEFGNPTYAPDLAGGLVALAEVAARSIAAGDAAAKSRGDAAGWRGFDGIHHIVNSGTASRAVLGRETLRLAGLDIPTEDVPMSTWTRPSSPPARAILAPTPLPDGTLLREWRAALAEYVATLSQTAEAK
jgi:dTDP-4-dehydrorhamnose reductase